MKYKVTLKVNCYNIDYGCETLKEAIDLRNRLLDGNCMCGSIILLKAQIFDELGDEISQYLK